MPRKQEVQLGLDGEPVKNDPIRTVVPRRDGPGFTIRVRRSDSRFDYVGVYASEGEAWQAIRAGEGKSPEDRETVKLSVHRR
jgi:hypothetical protein